MILRYLAFPRLSEIIPPSDHVVINILRHDQIFIRNTDSRYVVGGIRRHMPFEVNMDNIAPVVGFLFNLGIDHRSQMASDCLANLAGRLIGDFLPNDIAIVLYAEIQVTAAMLVQNGGNGDDSLFQLAGALFEFNLLGLVAEGINTVAH